MGASYRSVWLWSSWLTLCWSSRLLYLPSSVWSYLTFCWPCVASEGLSLPTHFGLEPYLTLCSSYVDFIGLSTSTVRSMTLTYFTLTVNAFLPQRLGLGPRLTFCLPRVDFGGLCLPLKLLSGTKLHFCSSGVRLFEAAARTPAYPPQPS